MSFIESIRMVYSKYATFSGRASRSEFWKYYLTLMAVSLVLRILSNLDGAGTAFSVLGVVILLGSIVPTLAVIWRRLHDTGRSGALYFIGLIPLVGPILLLVWLAGKPIAEEIEHKSSGSY